MNRYRHSKSSLFLMEIILNILFFSILVTFCLQIFFKAYRVSEGTSVLHRAVTICSSIAEICQSTENADNLLLTIYPDAVNQGENTIIYFDDNFTQCDKEKAVYQACVTPSRDVLVSFDVTFSKIETTDTIYTLSFCTYTPASLSDIGGIPHE